MKEGSTSNQKGGAPSSEAEVREVGDIMASKPGESLPAIQKIEPDSTILMQGVQERVSKVDYNG